jgi:hypothetical protein
MFGWFITIVVTFCWLSVVIGLLIGPAIKWGTEDPPLPRVRLGADAMRPGEVIESDDGRKWGKNYGREVFPWEGSSDTRVRLTDASGAPLAGVRDTGAAVRQRQP